MLSAVFTATLINCNLQLCSIKLLRKMTMDASATSSPDLGPDHCCNLSLSVMKLHPLFSALVMECISF
jgi:hypothetical protein